VRREAVGNDIDGGTELNELNVDIHIVSSTLVDDERGYHDAINRHTLNNGNQFLVAIHCHLSTHPTITTLADNLSSITDTLAEAFLINVVNILIQDRVVYPELLDFHKVVDNASQLAHLESFLVELLAELCYMVGVLIEEPSDPVPAHLLILRPLGAL